MNENKIIEAPERAAMCMNIKGDMFNSDLPEFRERRDYLLKVLDNLDALGWEYVDWLHYFGKKRFSVLTAVEVKREK